MRRSVIASALTVATSTVAAVRWGQRATAPVAPQPVAPPVPDPPAAEPERPSTDTGRWQAEDLESLPRQPLYSIAASRGVPERRLSHMSREEILDLLRGRMASRA